MKRGLITWDKAELPPSVFDTRLAKVRDGLAKQDLPALLVYSDVWRLCSCADFRRGCIHGSNR